MITFNRLGRTATGVSAFALAACATAPVPSGARCLRWRLVLEPRLTVSVDAEGDAKPIASVTARPVCAKRAAGS